MYVLLTLSQSLINGKNECNGCMEEFAMQSKGEICELLAWDPGKGDKIY
jgi:hypothetical protein